MSDRQALQPLVDALLADNREALDRYMAGNGASLVDLVWRPDAGLLTEPQLRHALEYWNGIRGERQMPLASEISPFELRPALGYVLLIDVEDDGWDGRFRLYGTRVAEMYGEDMTGKRVSDIDNNSYATQLFRAIYRVMTIRRAAVFSHHQPPLHVSVTAWKRLMLPLADETGAVCRFLSVNLPGAWRPAQPAGAAR
jgi:hypothetical protein